MSALFGLVVFLLSLFSITVLSNTNSNSNLFNSRRHKPTISNEIGIRRNIGNGCTLDDMVYFSNYVAHFIDKIVVDQNRQEISQDLFDLAYYFLKEDFTFHLSREDGTPILYFEGRDTYLQGEIYGFLPDKFWLYTLPGYAICEKQSNDITTAVYKHRGGDYLRAEEANVVILVNFEWSFVRDTSGDEDGLTIWRAQNYTAVAVTDFGYFAPTLTKN